MSRHLIIPDPHAHPDYSNVRFSHLGNLVSDIKPDHVICIGDWADMPSLSSYDRGTKGFEGRRYRHDIASAIEAQELFFSPIRKAKKKLPKFWMLEGNHEYRIKRAIDADATHLEGIISTTDLSYETFGWEYVPYEGATPGILQLDGIAYAHYFTTGVMGRPVGGLHPAYTLLNKEFMSCTQGHTHTTDYCVRTTAMKNYVHGLVAGCYIDYYQDYAGGANDMWWKGVVVKEDVQHGSYDPQWIGLNAIRTAYSET